MLNKSYILLSISVSFIIQIFEKYFFNDWQFLGFLVVLMSIDTITGFIKYWKLKQISSKGFSALFIKFLLYSSVLITGHVLTQFQINGNQNIIFSWIDDLIYSAIVVREAISIFENIAIINPELFPQWILKRLKAFDESGNLNDLNPQS